MKHIIFHFFYLKYRIFEMFRHKRLKERYTSMGEGHWVGSICYSTSASKRTNIMKFGGCCIEPHGSSYEAHGLNGKNSLAEIRQVWIMNHKLPNVEISQYSLTASHAQCAFDNYKSPTIATHWKPLKLVQLCLSLALYSPFFTRRMLSWRT